VKLLFYFNGAIIPIGASIYLLYLQFLVFNERHLMVIGRLYLPAVTPLAIFAGYTLEKLGLCRFVLFIVIQNFLPQTFTFENKFDKFRSCSFTTTPICLEMTEPGNVR